MANAAFIIVAVAYGFWLLFSPVALPDWVYIAAVVVSAFYSGYQVGSVVGLKKGIREALSHIKTRP